MGVTADKSIKVDRIRSLSFSTNTPQYCNFPFQDSKTFTVHIAYAHLLSTVYYSFHADDVGYFNVNGSTIRSVYCGGESCHANTYTGTFSNLVNGDNNIYLHVTSYGDSGCPDGTNAYLTITFIYKDGL